jgi:hypothetical protein
MRHYLAIAVYVLAALGVAGYAFSTGSALAEIVAVGIAAFNLYQARKVLASRPEKS